MEKTSIGRELKQEQTHVEQPSVATALGFKFEEVKCVFKVTDGINLYLWLQ